MVKIKYLQVPPFGLGFIRDCQPNSAWLREDIYKDLIGSFKPEEPCKIFDCGGANGTPIDGHPGGHINSFDLWYFWNNLKVVGSLMTRLLCCSKLYKFRANSKACKGIIEWAKKQNTSEAKMLIGGYQGNAVLIPDDQWNRRAVVGPGRPRCANGRVGDEAGPDSGLRCGRDRAGREGGSSPGGDRVRRRRGPGGD